MNKKVIIIHRWGGTSKSDWYPWIKKELEKKDFEVLIPDMPNTEEPKIEEWVGYLSELVKEPDDKTYFIGHSIGCQAILRYLEGLDDKRVGGVILVAPWFIISGLETEEEKEIAKPWLETPVNFDKIRKAANKFTAIFSDNDPYVPLEENRKIFEQKINSKIIVKQNKGHFDEDAGVLEFPALLETLYE